MTPSSAKLLRSSLVFVWLATAVVSVWELHGQSRELLAGLPNAWVSGDAAWLPTAVILAGAAADAVLGLWLALKPGRAAYVAALTLMGSMTLLATLIHPAIVLRSRRRRAHWAVGVSTALHKAQPRVHVLQCIALLGPVLQRRLQRRGQIARRCPQGCVCVL